MSLQPPSYPNRGALYLGNPITLQLEYLDSRNGESRTTSSSDSTASSSISENTVSTSHTNEGPGSLTGKALLAFGKLTLRGIESILLHRKLAAFSRLFPHEDDTTAIGLDQVYDDILELSRRGLYSSRIRFQALRLITMQIALERTQHLIKALKKWPVVEIQLLVTEIMMCMPHGFLSLARITHVQRRNHIDLWNNTYIPYSRGLKSAPLIIFLCRLAQASAVTCSAVLHGGFLDVLAVISLDDFSVPPRRESGTKMYEQTSLFADTSSIGTMPFTRDTNVSQMFLMHPIHLILPKTRAGSSQLTGRRKVWRILQEFPWAVEMRLAAIQDVMQSQDYVIDASTPYNVCSDLLEFSSSETLPPVKSLHWLMNVAFRWTVDLVSRSRIERLTYLEDNCGGTTKVLARFIQRLIVNSTESPPGEDLSWRDGIMNFLVFAFGVARVSDASKRHELRRGERDS